MAGGNRGMRLEGVYTQLNWMNTSGFLLVVGGRGLGVEGGWTLESTWVAWYSTAESVALGLAGLHCTFDGELR